MADKTELAAFLKTVYPEWDIKWKRSPGPVKEYFELKHGHRIARLTTDGWSEKYILEQTVEYIKKGDCLTVFEEETV